MRRSAGRPFAKKRSRGWTRRSRPRQIAAIYDARDELVAAYPEMAEDREILERLKQAGDLILKNVKYDATTRPAETEPREELLGPATTLVLARSGGPGGQRWWARARE